MVRKSASLFPNQNQRMTSWTHTYYELSREKGKQKTAPSSQENKINAHETQNGSCSTIPKGSPCLHCDDDKNRSSNALKTEHGVKWRGAWSQRTLKAPRLHCSCKHGDKTSEQVTCLISPSRPEIPRDRKHILWNPLSHDWPLCPP